MLHFTRWKQIAIVLSVVLGIALVIPSFFAKETVASWPWFVPRAQINLGLDLRGGAHLLLSMETAEVRKDWLDTLREDARKREVARSRIGVAVRPGAPRPDLSSADGFVRSLLAASSIAHSRSGASGLYFAGLIERLGIAEAVKAKTTVVATGFVAAHVVTGEVELGIQQISELMAVPGADIVGPLPPELQSITVFSAGIATVSKEPEAGRALIKFLASPAASLITGVSLRVDGGWSLP